MIKAKGIGDPVTHGIGLTMRLPCKGWCSVLDIDEPEVAASVHVYVNTSRLTSLDPRALLVVTARPAHPTLVPCTPAQPGVRVQLLAGDTELTEYQDPVIKLSNVCLIFWVSWT